MQKTPKRAARLRKASRESMPGLRYTASGNSSRLAVHRSGSGAKRAGSASRLLIRILNGLVYVRIEGTGEHSWPTWEEFLRDVEQTSVLRPAKRARSTGTASRGRRASSASGAPRQSK